MKCLVAISISREWVESDFLMHFATWIIPEGWQVKYGWFRQFTAAERHNVSINEAKYNYDRIIYMDTDQMYPYDYLVRMLAHNEPVVSALNVSRYYPFEFTTYRFDGEEEKYGVIVPRIVNMEPPADKQIFECDITGTGAIMIDPKILDKLPMPYFKDIFDPEGCIRLVPDDFYFGWLLHKAGIKVTVDQSIMVRHIAKMLAAPYNVSNLRRAWDASSGRYGHWKDGKK